MLDLKFAVFDFVGKMFVAGCELQGQVVVLGASQALVFGAVDVICDFRFAIFY